MKKAIEYQENLIIWAKENSTDVTELWKQLSDMHQEIVKSCQKSSI